MKNLFFLILILYINIIQAQQQIEAGVFNTFSVLRLYNQSRDVQDKEPKSEGEAVDYGRNNIIVRVNNGLQKFEYSYGLGYMRYKYGFEDPNYVIFQDYKCLSLLGSLKKKWETGMIFTCLSFDVLPSFIIAQEGFYSKRPSYFEEFKLNKFGFSHIETRLTYSIQFMKSKNFHIVLNWFIQPPNIYITNILKSRINSYNTGLGIGLAFDKVKKAR